MVHLTYDSGYYAIDESWVVKEIYPIQTGEFAGRSALLFQLTDSEGNELSLIRVRDPSIVRGPLLSPEDAARLSLPTPHHTMHKKRGSLVLRFPQYRNVRYINLEKLQNRLFTMAFLNCMKIAHYTARSLWRGNVWICKP